MSRKHTLLGLALVALTGGCSSNFNGSAPADAGGHYAVGAKQGATTEAAIWHCPDDAADKKKKCKRMEVEEK